MWSCSTSQNLIYLEKTSSKSSLPQGLKLGCLNSRCGQRTWGQACADILCLSSMPANSKPSFTAAASSSSSGHLHSLWCPFICFLSSKYLLNSLAHWQFPSQSFSRGTLRNKHFSGVPGIPSTFYNQQLQVFKKTSLLCKEQIKRGPNRRQKLRTTCRINLHVGNETERQVIETWLCEVL